MTSDRYLKPPIRILTSKPAINGLWMELNATEVGGQLACAAMSYEVDQVWSTQTSPHHQNRRISCIFVSQENDKLTCFV